MEHDRKHQETRRKLLAGGSVACAMGLVGGLGARANAAEQDVHPGGTKGVAAVVIDASREGICATCRFWGGTRRVAEDRKSVHAESLGWYKNRESPMFQTMRTPESGPMTHWRKWEAL